MEKSFPKNRQVHKSPAKTKTVKQVFYIQTKQDILLLKKKLVLKRGTKAHYNGSVNCKVYVRRGNILFINEYVFSTLHLFFVAAGKNNLVPENDEYQHHEEGEIKLEFLSKIRKNSPKQKYKNKMWKKKR